MFPTSVLSTTAVDQPTDRVDAAREELRLYVVALNAMIESVNAPLGVAGLDASGCINEAQLSRVVSKSGNLSDVVASAARTSLSLPEPNTLLSKSGGTMTGALSMVGHPSGGDHVVTKGYADSQLNAKATLLAPALTGVPTVEIPTQSNGLGNKVYVESQVSAATSGGEGAVCFIESLENRSRTRAGDFFRYLDFPTDQDRSITTTLRSDRNVMSITENAKGDYTIFTEVWVNVAVATPWIPYPGIFTLVDPRFPTSTRAGVFPAVAAWANVISNTLADGARRGEVRVRTAWYGTMTYFIGDRFSPLGIRWIYDDNSRFSRLRPLLWNTGGVFVVMR